MPALARSVLAALIASCTVPAWGALGQPLASVESDRVRLKASLRSVARDGYSIHEIALPMGTTVRQFSSGTGPVFGVAWEGPRVPDLRQLLGEYFEAYSRAARERRGRRRPLVVQLPGLVLESYGHARAFHGRAYLPEQLPSGVPPDAIR